ncbi:MAG: FAD:protein FMN transferase [Candidatus Omnitrophica bacterium]|nr:FAD:protein FMN transferase [Candidatus Omnitrophota bacterium]
MYLTPSTPTDKVRSSVQIRKRMKPVMGTFAYAQVLSSSGKKSEKILDTIFSVLEKAENTLSRFRSESAVSIVNQSAFSSPVRLDACSYRLLKLCRQLNIQTGGSFNIAVAPLMDLWRESAAENKFPPLQSVQKNLDLADMDQIQFDDRDHSVRFLREGIGIDLGAIGKGYALDMVRDCLRDQKASAMVNLGGNIFHLNGAIDCFSIRHPLDERRVVESIPAETCSVSTSSNRELTYCIQGKKIGHLQDLKRNAHPDILSVTVSADSAAMADAFSTCLFLMDKETGLALAKEYGVRYAVIIYRQPRFWNSKLIRVERYQL